MGTAEGSDERRKNHVSALEGRSLIEKNDIHIFEIFFSKIVVPYFLHDRCISALDDFFRQRGQIMAGIKAYFDGKEEEPIAGMRSDFVKQAFLL